MSKILVAECKQESSSFNPVLSHYEDFSIAAGDDVLARHRGVRSEIAGALSVFGARPDVQVIPAYSARSITSGGELPLARLVIGNWSLVIAVGFVANLSWWN